MKGKALIKIDPKSLAALVLIEDKEIDDVMRLLMSIRNETHELYRSSSEEEYHRILIQTRLDTDDEKFRVFLRGLIQAAKN